jgi:PAS domain S-box-containing protein
MKPYRKAHLIFAGGAAIVLMICIMQYYTDLVHGTVYVLITGLYLLWLLRNYRYVYVPTGLLVTAGIVAGYVYGHEHGPGPLINRVFSVFIFWLGVSFTMRFKKLSDKEKKSRHQLDALFENVSEAILLIDSKGKIVMGNPGAVRIFGFSREELQGMQIENLIPERFRGPHAGWREAFLQNHSTRQIGSGKDIYGLRKGNGEFPVELGLSTFYHNDELFVIAFVTDITRRKEQEEKILSQYTQLQDYNVKLEDEVKLRTAELCRALDSVRTTNENLVRQIEERMTIEDQLRKSQILYKAVARNFPDGIIAILNKDLKFVFVEGRELTGVHLRDNSQVHGTFDGLHKIVLERNGREIRKAFEGDKVNFEIEVEKKFYDVVATPLRDADRPAAEIFIVIRNVTRYKEFEQGLKQALEKEKQLNVLKSTFVSNVSHEFRTPLTTILSSVFLLENYNKPDAEAQRKNYTSRIRRSVNTLTELLEDFLSLEKLAEGKVSVHYSHFALSTFLEDFVKELDGIRKPDQTITLSITGHPDFVITDRSILSNILNNLVSNAIKYSPKDGEILLSAHLESGVLELSVKDNGMGIPESDQKHIFERFYRAHNAANIQGTGLGLNLVKKYVSLLQGQVRFESALNAGCKFTINIPVDSRVSSDEDYLAAKTEPSVTAPA